MAANANDQKQSELASTTSAAQSTALTVSTIHDNGASGSSHAYTGATSGVIGDQPWPVYLAQALMGAVISSSAQPSQAAAALFAVFHPILEGWAVALAQLRDARRWREEAETEAAEREKSLREAEQRLADSEAQRAAAAQEAGETRRLLEGKMEEMAAHKKGSQVTVSEMQKRLAAAERKAHESIHNLKQEAEKKEELHSKAVAEALSKTKENEIQIATLEQELNLSKSTEATLQELLAQKTRECSNLESCLTEANNREETLRRQLATYARTTTRRFIL